MEQARIMALLQSDDAAFQKAGLSEIVRGLPRSLPLAFSALGSAPERVALDLAENMRIRLPWLRSGHGPPRQGNKGPHEYFDGLRREMEAGLADLADAVARTPDENRPALAARLARFGGIAAEARALIAEAWGSEPALLFGRALAESADKEFERQFMIFPSYRCNLSCAYCFARDLDTPDMELDRLLGIVQWASENGAHRITFCGGEPTIYPGFADVLERIAGLGMGAYFATNLLAGPRVMDAIAQGLAEALVVHVPPPDTYAAGQWELLGKNLDRALAAGVRLGLRINMSSAGDDFSHVFALAEEKGVGELQFAVTFSGLAGSNRHARAEDFKSLAPAIGRLIAECQRRGMKFVFSKPFPLCLFPDELAGDLARRFECSPQCGAHLDGHARNACVSPAGELSPCLGLPGRTVPLAGIRDWSDMGGFCAEHLAPLLDAPLFEHCAGCFLFERRLCQGACVSHKKPEGAS